MGKQVKVVVPVYYTVVVDDDDVYMNAKNAVGGIPENADYGEIEKWQIADAEEPPIWMKILGAIGAMVVMFAIPMVGFVFLMGRFPSHRVAIARWTYGLWGLEYCIVSIMLMRNKEKNEKVLSKEMDRILEKSDE